MSLQIRDFRDGDREQVALLWSVAFYAGRPMDDEPVAKKGQRVFVAESEGRVIGAFKLHDLSATRGSAVLRCAGVGLVAVLPEYRQKGVGRDMLTWALERFRSEGTPLASLYGFRESYYRKFGWECVGRQIRITCPNHRLPRVECTLPVRQFASNEWRALEDAYRQFATRYSGMNERTAVRWARVFREGIFWKGDLPHIAYAVGDPVEAYAVLQLAADAWGHVRVSELVWTTPEGYRSLLGVLAGIGFNQASLTWVEPSDGPFLSEWTDEGVRAELEPPIMFRVVDVPGALRLLQPKESGEFTIAIADEQLAANRGPWRVAFSEDGVAVEKCSEAAVRMDVRHFAQALLGEPSFERLLEQGFASATAEKAVKEACVLLPPRPTYCLDKF